MAPADTRRRGTTDDRPHRSLPHRATSAAAYAARPEATPGTDGLADTHDRLRRDKVDKSRALFDAVSMLRPAGSPESSALGKVTSGRRALAMAVLQEHRPDLDHTALIAVVDAAAMWTNAHEDYLVTSLLRAVGGDEVAGAAYLALTGIGARRPPEGREQSEGLPS